MRTKRLETHRALVRKDLADPEYRAEWARTSLAHDVAMRVIAYRVQDGLTQAELAARLGMRQPHVARLEAGDHEPSLTTLRRVGAYSLGLAISSERR